MSSQLGCIENDYVKLWIENGIIHECIKIDRITLAIAKEIVSSRLKLSDGVTMPIFIYTDSKRNTVIEKDARDYFSTPESMQYLSASAMLVDNYARLIVGRLFLSFIKPSIEVEIFRSNHKALEWLEKYK